MNVINHLSTLETAGLVRLAQVTPDLEYLFRHVLVQDAVYASLLKIDQKRLHSEVGEALEWLYPDRLDELAPTLAHHYEIAGDRSRALQYFQRAANAALSSFANKEAETNFRSALALDPAPQVQASLYNGLGEALYLESRFGDAIQAWQQAITIYRQTGDSENLARLYARSARAAWFEDQKARALEICLEGMQAVSGAPQGPGVAGLIHETARAYFFANQPDKALPLCRQALELGERLGAVDVQADALSTLGLLPGLTPDEVIAALTRAVELSEAAGLLLIASRAHINLGSAKLEHLKDIKACRDHYLRSAEMARRRGALQEELFGLLAAAQLLTQMGELDELERTLPELERLQHELQDPPLTANQLAGTKAIIHGMRGDWQKALDILGEVLEELKDDPDQQKSSAFQDVALQIYAELAVLGHPIDNAQVQQIIDQALKLEGPGKIEEMKFSLLAHAAILWAATGKMEEAEHCLSEARRLNKPDSTHHRTILAVAEIEVAAAVGRLPEMLPLFDEIQGEMERANTYFLGRHLTRWGQAHLLRGEPDDLEQAQALLARALAIFQKLRNSQQVTVVEKHLQSSRDQTFAQAAEQKKTTQELVQAARIQGSFLPIEPPHIPGWQIAIAFQPARQTSGDFYDFIPLPDGRLVIAISDVADKGIGAALYMASARSLLRAYAVEFPGEPRQVILRANRRLTTDTHGGLFVTLFYGVLDPTNGELLYVNAGHNPPYRFSPGEDPLALVKTGIPLGIFDDVDWEQKQARLDPGSLLVLYTDGVTEAIDSQENQFGEAGLARSVLAHMTQPDEIRALAVRDGLLQDIRAHRGRTPQADDITLMVISR
jgi:serine phosphatase RsbU (regulator of sigma subunit)